ncbi:putative Flagellar biosynthetic protein [Desulfamplus magnetovallimortis]|uniref:Putative Flagellar biosynthetic protein n=1 Tax=Desulfamplus magnetovallimortis TaxID=1246637 RepID=A0A1W1HHY5_9BACT|nr:hypothetical protein [Desulfamplus magnetovallimortis]SLM32117.1 putative Flagellar biosynthetic protein [Desulfamplus magnetovallimortis]
MKFNCNIRHFVFASALLFIMILVSGCATNRGILDVQINEAPNPASTKIITISEVNDIRVFEKAPRQASIPSLKGGEIDNKEITLRAIARKRNGYGKALGDILLPEGNTVEQLVKDALVKSFRESGYYVIDDKSETDKQKNAVPVKADIEQFWAWVTPGFWTISLEFEAKVKIKGDIPSFENGDTVRGYVKLHTQAAGTKAWMNTMDKGLESFVSEVKKRLSN